MAVDAGGSWLANLFRSATGHDRSEGSPRYTIDEVKAALRQPRPDERTRRIHDCVAILGALVDDLSVRRRFRGLEDYHRRLPRILTLYCRGWEVEAIAAELSLFSTPAGVACAIDTVALVIAERLNRQPAA